MSCSPPERVSIAADARQRVELAHDQRRVAQVADRLEQRHDDQRIDRAPVAFHVERAAHEADFLLQQQHLEQVAHVFGVRNDVVAQRAAAITLQHLDRALEDAELAARELRVTRAQHAQRSRVVEQTQQQAASRRLVERGVVGFDARDLQQLGDHRFVLVGALPQVDGREMEAEHLHRALQRRQPRCDQRVRMVRLQRVLDHLQVGEQLVGARVRVLRRDRVAQCLGAGQLVQRRREPRVHADQRTAIRFVLAMRALVGRTLGQRLHLGRHRREQRGDRQLGTQLVQLGQVKAQRGFALARERHAQRVGADVRIAVAVAADPVAGAEEARDVVPGQRALDLEVQPRHLAQERGAVVRERVFDFVRHTELRVTQHARLPQLRDACAQQRLVVVALALRGERIACFDQLGDRALGVEDALALHLGRVCGQHRRDVRVLQRLRDVRWLDARLREPLETHRQRAVLQVAFALVHLAAAHVVAVLGDVGQVREIAERADHTDGLVGRQVLQQVVERRAGARVALEPISDRQAADALDQLEGLVALLFADHVAEDAAEQPDVRDQGAVLVARVEIGGGRGGCARAGHGEGS